MKQLQNKNLSDITNLVMASCTIKELYVGTFNLFRTEKFTTLRLEQNRIKDLPETLFNSTALTDLKELNLRYNDLSLLSPKHFAYLLNLQTLYLDYNKFTTFKAGLFVSNPIKSLTLDGNFLEILPEAFLAGNISITLKTFNIYNNKLKGIPHCISKTSGFQAFLPELELLSLGKNNIRELPIGWFNSTNWSFLQYLDLSFNKLKTLPGKLFHTPYLQNLKVINLGFNQINSLSSGFLKNQALENLTKVYLNNNNLQSVTEDMLPVKLLRLLDLNLANNKLSSIGDIISKVLIRDILEDVNGFRRYCTLNLSYNHLTVQQTNFIETYNSKAHINGYLDLSHNKISKFEDNLHFEKQLMPFTPIPLDRKWLYSFGNQIFSVKNLVKTVSGFDLNQVNISEPRFPLVRAYFRLQVLIKAFDYVYDCNCDMLKYRTFQTKCRFKESVERYNQMRHHNEQLIESAPLILCYMPNNLKCGSPNHLQGKYLDQVKDIELQCKNSNCTENKNCTCTETPHNNTLKINCSKLRIVRSSIGAMSKKKILITKS